LLSPSGDHFDYQYLIGIGEEQQGAGNIRYARVVYLATIGLDQLGRDLLQECEANKVRYFASFTTFCVLLLKKKFWLSLLEAPFLRAFDTG
jgi:hypothetical protein